jgi:GNAT superfamily N-acetyltransferase
MNASENTRNLLRTNSENLDFRALVHLLDQDLAIRDGEDHAFYDQFNKIDKIAHALVAFEGNQPIGCGAIRAYAPTIMEVKRMFVLPAYRGKGVAAAILIELERWAAELGYAHCRLETGKKQPEAIRLYQKSGYTLIPNYGPYEQAENSVCMEKSLG